VAAACHQIGRGIYHGTMKHFHNALLKLKQFPDMFLSIDALGLVQTIERCCEHVKRLGRERLREFDAVFFPVIVSFK